MKQRRRRKPRVTSPTIFDNWSTEKWREEVTEGAAQLPDSAREAIELVYQQGLTFEAAAEKIQGHPVELLARVCIAVRLVQEHLQRRHATIEPPWPRRGLGVPGAPIPKHNAVMTALKDLSPT